MTGHQSARTLEILGFGVDIFGFFPLHDRMTTDRYDLGAGAAAEILGCTAQTARVWAAAGLLPAIRTPGGHYRFRRSDLEAFLESRRIAQVAS